MSAVTSAPGAMAESTTASTARFPIRIERRGSRWRLIRVIGAVAALALLILPELFLPFLERGEWTKVIALSVSLWGLVLLLGPAGQLSLGHGAFMGFGAFFTGIFSARYDLPVFVALVPVALFGFLFGVLVGLPALRVRGQYLAMVTLAVAVAFPQVIQRFSWYTGGASGPAPIGDQYAPGWLGGLRDHTWLHLQICLVAVLAWLLVRNLLNSATGRAIKAAASNEDAAAAMGIPVGRTMTLTYGFGSMLGAIGGGLWVIQVRGVSTDEFDVLRSIILYAVVVFGGSSSLGGACMGALLFVSAGWMIAKFGWRFSPNMIYAVVLLAVTAFFSGGLAEALAQLLRKVVVIVEPIPEPVSGGAVPAPTTPGAGG